ncbi:hypothetical protein ACFPL7_22070 [Dongia soli]|uniref:ClpX C4-type zinc finger protein n=1 Tax=Dongia soli TaxID=600628 RepID=A0ABU5E8N6_9PROT|nr:hypothetical protein [Dongia soli]MDY0882277.1 hypothetical protein [Dongia soli]
MQRCARCRRRLKTTRDDTPASLVPGDIELCGRCLDEDDSITDEMGRNELPEILAPIQRHLRTRED